MKRTGLMFLMLGASLIFFACEKMNPNPDSGNDLDTATLKGAKVETVTTAFTGTCVPVANPHPPNTEPTIEILPTGQVWSTGEVGEWYDEANDPRVTGRSIWHIDRLIEKDGTQHCDAKTTLIVEGGKWAFETEGDIIPILDGDVPIGLEAVFEADGKGTHGQVKGLTAHWTYSLEYYFDDPTTLVYYVKGTINGKRANGKYSD